MDRLREQFIQLLRNEIPQFFQDHVEFRMWQLACKKNNHMLEYHESWKKDRESFANKLMIALFTFLALLFSGFFLLEPYQSYYIRFWAVIEGLVILYSMVSGKLNGNNSRDLWEEYFGDHFEEYLHDPKMKYIFKRSYLRSIGVTTNPSDMTNFDNIIYRPGEILFLYLEMVIILENKDIPCQNYKAVETMININGVRTDPIELIIWWICKNPLDIVSPQTIIVGFVDENFPYLTL